MHHTRINTDKDARALVTYLLKLSVVSVDSETDGLEWRTGNLFFLQFADRYHCWIVDCRRVDIYIFKPLLESKTITKIIHNSAFDAAWWAREFQIFARNIHDSRYQEQVVLGVALQRGLTKAAKAMYEPKYSASLKWCFNRRGWDDKEEFEPFYPLPWEPSEKQVNYMVHDVDMLIPLMEDQIATIENMGLGNVSVLENEISHITYMMMYNGLGVDVKGWLDYTQSQETEYNQIMTRLAHAAPGLNWQSPKQYCNFFGVSRTAQLDELTIEDYIEADGDDERYMILLDFRRARELYKNVTTYGRSFIEKYVINGEIHCQYTQIVNTARYSSDNPNMQNLPSESMHRSFIRSTRWAQGWVLVRADFSGQEMAIIAYGSGEESWVECLRNGGDLHSKVAADIIDGWENLDHKTQQRVRRVVKIINFSIAYGAGNETIAQRAGTTVEDIKAKMAVMRKKYPKVFRWLNANARAARLTYESRSFPPFNRYRSLAMETEGWRRENIGKNNPVQMTAADMSKLAMFYFQIEIDNGLPARLLHMEHDELIGDCARADSDHVAQVMSKCMTQACIDILGEPLSQPDVKVSDSWNKKKD